MFHCNKNPCSQVNVFMLMEVMKALTKMPAIYVAQVLVLL